MLTDLIRTRIETVGPDIKVNSDDDSTVLTCGNSTEDADEIKAEVVSDDQIIVSTGLATK